MSERSTPAPGAPSEAPGAPSEALGELLEDMTEYTSYSIDPQLAFEDAIGRARKALALYRASVPAPGAAGAGEEAAAFLDAVADDLEDSVLEHRAQMSRDARAHAAALRASPAPGAAPAREDGPTCTRTRDCAANWHYGNCPRVF